MEAATGTVRPVWSADGEDPIRIFVDGSIVEAFTTTGSTTIRAYPASGEVWRVSSSGALDATTLRQG